MPVKLVTYQPLASPLAAPRVGALLPEEGHGAPAFTKSLPAARLLDLQAAQVAQRGTPDSCLADMLSLLDAGEEALDRVRALVTVADQFPEAIREQEPVRLLAPVPRPRSLRDAMAFERHLVQASRQVLRERMPFLATLDEWLERRLGRGFVRPPRVWYERPVYYKGNPASCVGHDADICWPSYARQLDYELEFGVYIGRQGKNIRAEAAREYIAGYTIFNDFSARDVQLDEMGGRLGPAKGKDFDTGNALGPCLVTADELPDPRRLTMVARVNGVEWSRGNSCEMRYSFEDLIAYISQDETLYPGDFIGSGTVGNGCGLELNRRLEPGDVVELEVEGLGVLRNRVRLDAH